MTTLTHRTSTIAWRITTYTELARIVSQSLIITLTFMAQAESCTFHLISIPSMCALVVYVLYLPTGYEPKAHDFDELQNSSVPFSFKIPIADQDVDDLTLGKMLTEAYRGQVDYFVQGGVSVSQSSSSVRSDRSGQPDGERMVGRSIRKIWCHI